MKNLSMNVIKMSSTLLITLSAYYPSVATDISEKVVEKARYAVEQAAPDDWHTLAKSAAKCIRKGVNLKEAVTWLEQSLQIKRTFYNLEVQGDYFAGNQLPEKAVHAYAESYRLAILRDAYYDSSEICQKIKQQVMRLGQSYDGELEALSAQELSHRRTGTTLHAILNNVW